MVETNRDSQIPSVRRAEEAAELALRHGAALLKHITDNNVGRTGSHETGYYLPKAAAPFFTPQPPEDGINHTHDVTISWPEGLQTESCVKWYGAGTRSEYRITRFGRDFPYLTHESVGDLLVLIPRSPNQFSAFVLSGDDEVEHLKAILGVEIVGGWALYDRQQPDEEPDCIIEKWSSMLEKIEDYPETRDMSKYALTVLSECWTGFYAAGPDDQLTRLRDTEYRMYRRLEKKLLGPELGSACNTVDDFLTLASSVLNRRKSRGGKSLEHHVEQILRQQKIPFEAQPKIDGKPDFVIPGKAEYEDSAYPGSKLIVLAVKSTCKDRWRQVLKEAKRVPVKHLLTFQEGVSSKQLQSMRSENVELVVPRHLHREFAKDDQPLLRTVAGFVDYVKKVVPK